MVSKALLEELVETLEQEAAAARELLTEPNELRLMLTLTRVMSVCNRVISERQEEKGDDPHSTLPLPPKQ